MGEMGAGHFIYIPAMILLGVVIGWILGSRAAQGRVRRRTAPPGGFRGTGGREGGQDAGPAGLSPAGVQRPRLSRLASASGRPASRIRAWARSTAYSTR